MASQAGAKFPELCAAQYVLETGWGRHLSGKNNLFGLKGSGTVVATTEYINGKEVSIKDSFLDFETPNECINYLVDRWYKDYKGYKGINKASTREEAALLLVKEGYSTDPKYAEKLVKLMNANSIPAVNKSSQSNKIKLADAAFYYKGAPHQVYAWEKLQESLTEEQLAEFEKNYRKKEGVEIPGVVYYYQRDSKTGHGERSCQSSAIAMVISKIRPELIDDDDEYLRLVFKYGDTVSQDAHQKALSELGVKASFRMNGNRTDLLRLLDKGVPVPIGILHKGPSSAPRGGGHWITLVGYDNNNFIVNDPFGKLNLKDGIYSSSGSADGRLVRYDKELLMKRWLIQSQSDGWFWDFSANWS